MEDASEEEMQKVAAAYLKVASEKDDGKNAADVERCVADAQDSLRGRKASWL
jgi:hypothetical protein